MKIQAGLVDEEKLDSSWPKVGDAKVTDQALRSIDVSCTMRETVVLRSKSMCVRVCVRVAFRTRHLATLAPESRRDCP